MTVNYNLLISDSSPISRIKLLLRWRGSIWKALLSELTLWIICFTLVAYVYNQWLTESEQRAVVRLTKHLNDKMDYIPLNFILSFFVTAVVARWTHIFHNIGMIDSLALSVAFNIPGSGDRVRMIRRNIIRYAVQAQLLVFRDVSTQVRKRFPTIDSTVTANFISEDELATYLNYDHSYTLARWWLPIVWAQNAVHAAKADSMIRSDIQYKSLDKMLIAWRNQLAQVVNYDWVPLPLMYPQLVILAVHSYFYLCLISRQISFLDYEQWELGIIEENISKCVFSVLQFIFYVGWLKVAEALLNPMGEDDDDFETNFLLDRNLKIGLAIVDRGATHCPPLVEDPHWDQNQPLLYSENSRPVHPLYGSAAQLGLSIDRKDSVATKGEPVKMVPLEGDLEETPVTRKPTRMELPKIMLEKFKRPSLPYTRNRINSNGNLTPKDFRSSTPESTVSPSHSPYFTHVGFVSVDEEAKDKAAKESPQLFGFAPIESGIKPKLEPRTAHRVSALDDIQEENTPKIEQPTRK